MTAIPVTLLPALTGATAATRYVGGTASGAPASGTFAVGDFVIDQTGQVWICITAGSPGTWRCATRDRDGIRATGLGLGGQNYDRMLAGTSTVSIDGTIYLCSVALRAGETVTNGHVVCSGAATGAGTTLAKMGLYSKAGSRLAVTADLGSAWESQGTKTHAFGTPYPVTADDLYYLAIVCKNTGTLPSFLRNSALAAGAAAVGSGKIAFGSITGQTDLGTSISPAAGSNPIAYWMGWS